MIKVLLFDADGVTITPPGYGSTYAAQQAGLGVTDLQSFFTKEFVACKQGKADLKVEIQPYLNRIGWKKSVDEFLQTWFAYENVVDERMFVEIKELRNKGVFCALTTDQEKYRKDFLLYEMNFQEKFDLLYVSSDIGFSKQEQDYFLYVFSDVNTKRIVQKDEVLLIDDTPHVIDAAKEFGIHAELYKEFSDFEKIKDTYNL